jgi:hypothetical protein
MSEGVAWVLHPLYSPHLLLEKLWPVCSIRKERDLWYSWKLTVSGDRVNNLIPSWPRYHWEGKEDYGTAKCMLPVSIN